MLLWYFGNTTVRSPFRLRDGLVAISNSNIEGKLRGVKNELTLNRILGDSGTISFQGDVTYSAGRKWRSALEKLGFLYPKLDDIQDEIGDTDTITENGRRLLESDSVLGWQECFLRSLSAYFIPSILEPRYKCNIFSPLRHTLSIMLELERRIDVNYLTIIEIAIIVQRSTSEEPISDIVERIIEFRKNRDASSNKRVFDKEALDYAAKEYQHKLKSDSFKDYADLNIRYLKATGLVQGKGKGISLLPEKRKIIETLVQDKNLPKDSLFYIRNLCSGASLPTDQKDTAITILNDLINQLKNRGETFDISRRTLDSPADIDIIRYEIEERLSELNEIDYANRQSELLEEISGYMDLLISQKRKKTLSSGDEIEIPQTEAPAYFEWIVWRMFLSINSLTNAPWESRRFKIDQDFLPISTAPGNGPDMVFYFEDMILVVEVTLTTSSRQEATEGESVRRHVAKYAEEHLGTGLQVFGLFLAIAIDTNTANTFRLGEWYLADDRKIDLHIIPISLVDFKAIFDAASSHTSSILPILKGLLRDCRMYVVKDAPDWKRQISEIVKSTAKSLVDGN